MFKLLLTGATGFLGGAVAEKVLSDMDNVGIYFLVRGTDVESALARLRKNLSLFNVSERHLQSITEENIILGDLGYPEAFLEHETLADITHVINCAAVASFGSNPLIWKVNVEGTLKFAKRMEQTGNLKKFIHVGTAMSCTPTADMLVCEQKLDTGSEGHLVAYTHSKATIEILMAQECPDLPLIIARPSIVVGHSTLGCTPSASIFWVFSMAMRMKKFLCALEDKIDVIPVDYCADALIMMMTGEAKKGDIFHVSAGECSSVSFAEVDKAFAKAHQQMPVGDTYQKVTHQALIKERSTFPSLFGPCNVRLMLKAMKLYGAFASLNVTFSNEKILKLGLPQPPRFTDYLHLCVDSTQHLTIAEQMAVDYK